MELLAKSIRRNNKRKRVHQDDDDECASVTSSSAVASSSAELKSQLAVSFAAMILHMCNRRVVVVVAV